MVAQLRMALQHMCNDIQGIPHFFNIEYTYFIRNHGYLRNWDNILHSMYYSANISAFHVCAFSEIHKICPKLSVNQCYWFNFFNLYLQKFLSNTEALLRKFLPEINCGLHTACDHLLEVCIAAGGKTQHVIWFSSSLRMDYE